MKIGNLVSSERLLVLSPHTDDHELGAGGFLSRVIDIVAGVRLVVFSTCRESLPDGTPPDTLEKEYLRSAQELGVATNDISVFDFPVRRFNAYRQEILEELINIRRDFKPSLVLCPASVDVHQDHGVIAAEAFRAFKGSATILGYELPWNHMESRANFVVSLSESDIQNKNRLLACYASQIELARPYFDPVFIESWARTKGVSNGVDFAEVFELKKCLAR